MQTDPVCYKKKGGKQILVLENKARVKIKRTHDKRRQVGKGNMAARGERGDSTSIHLRLQWGRQSGGWKGSLKEKRVNNY